MSQQNIKQIEHIYIPTHKYDLRLTRICVASIRFWYPNIPIFLIKDESFGTFDTTELEKYWGVQIFKTNEKKFGWGFSHLEPIFLSEPTRFLVVDSDIAFVGRVLDYLNEQDADFIVQLEDQQEDNLAPDFDGIYFSLDNLRQWDIDFEFPGYTFNAGQFVGTGGLIKRQDFDALINWTSPRTVIKPEIFNYGDQGTLNYTVMKKAMANEITLARVPFMKWGHEQLAPFDLDKINSDSPYRCLIHWAGLRKPKMQAMIRADILFKFENFYYTRIPFGAGKRKVRLLHDAVANLALKIRARLSRKPAVLNIA